MISESSDFESFPKTSFFIEVTSSSFLAYFLVLSFLFVVGVLPLSFKHWFTNASETDDGWESSLNKDGCIEESSSSDDGYCSEESSASLLELVSARLHMYTRYEGFA